MSPSRPLLIFLLLFLNPALGFPVAKRLSHTEVSEDVLAGTDFLSVFMKTSPARSVTPSFKYSSIFGAKTRNSDYSETNSVVQKNKEDIHPYSDINLKGEDALESDSHVAVDHQAQLEHEEEIIESNSPDNLFTQKAMTATENNVTDPTTSSPSTTTLTDDSAPSTYYEIEEDHPSIVQGFREDRSTKPTVTQYWSDPQPYPPPPTPASSNSSEQPLQVISVRVSSSVVRHSQKVEDPLKGFESEKTNKPESTLVTQEQPTNTAIQRSHFNVEEATLPEDHASYHGVESSDKILPSSLVSTAASYRFNNLNNKPISSENNLPKVYDTEIKQDESRKLIENISTDFHQSEAEEEERKIQQTDFLKLSQNQNQSLAKNDEPYLKDEMNDRTKDYIEEETKPPDQRNEPRALPYQFKYHAQPHQPSSSGFQEHDFLKDGSIEKNSDFSEEREERLQHEERQDQPQALAFQYNPPNPQLSPISYHTSVSSATSGSRVQFYRGPPSYRRGNVAESVQRAVLAEPKREFQLSVPAPQKQEHQGEPVEKSYELPEQNYEIDESISVVTNGRAHGVQIPTPTPTRPSSENEKDENKSGYVVEGRNFRKYRVEERTADGFIVGEYGVVSHDDGSLRGVRYTADGTINPRLIYDALVKFLSLK